MRGRHGKDDVKPFYREIERIDVPASVADLAWRRTYAFLRASIYDRDAMRLLMSSCYLQGLEDGMEAAARLDYR